MAHIDEWQENDVVQKVLVTQMGHFPNNHTKLDNWCCNLRKRMRGGLMTTEQKDLLEALAATRSDEHTVCAKSL